MKNVLVTGATGGMGKAICSMLNKKGYKVYGLDYKQGESYDNVKLYQCDVTNTESVKKAFDEVSAEAKELYAIIHTAGIYDMDSLIEMDEIYEKYTQRIASRLFGSSLPLAFCARDIRHIK